jgi:hypothetical protein
MSINAIHAIMKIVIHAGLLTHLRISPNSRIMQAGDIKKINLPKR